MGRDLEYSTEKARTRLGWAPALSYRESIERTVRWLVEHERAAEPGRPAPPALTARIRPTSPDRQNPERRPKSCRPGLSRPDRFDKDE